MNELLDAAKNAENDRGSEDRYEKLKKEEAGTDQNPAKERYQELKEEAKEEFVEKQRQREKEEEQKEAEEEEEDDPFVVH